ncbi:quinohemoprotein amine dehydrogenase subunit alpha [Paremcibacter congregatus]|uniref:quinohemoprotein amine dehydrogenase subunit alpha n=1 Tax=Paremcibacter congregatus TaxID=2043170 RepID=UPI0030EDC52E
MTHKNILTHLLGLTLFLTLASCSEQSKQTDKISNVGPAEMQAGRALLSDNCSGCHVESADGTFSRISQIRKSPEGWDMNIARMTVFHGLHIEPEDRRALVKFLSDTQGLAPTETAAHRDVLERKHNVIEQGVDPDLAAMCARCHTYARVALQRRDKAEWQNLVHMHLGQWASIEYQMLSRERDWRADALGPVAEKLGEMYPLQTEAWSAWQKTEWQNMAGDWRIIGHIPGVGDVDGVMTATAGEGDTYTVTYNFIWPDGSLVAGTGKSIVHGGYEWRGAATLNDQKYRQIWAASEDGNQMRGRMFHKDHPEDGIAITALRKTSDRAAIMNVSPFALKAGDATEIVISGMGLSGDVKIPGVDVKVVSTSSDRIVVVATAGADASGATPLSVGTQKSAQDVVLYTQVDYLKVTPDYGISRVGGGGGPIPKVMAQFEATGYTVGPDGIRDTADDLMLGLVPVTWSVDNYNETAAEMQDKKYAGTITATGTFIPAVAGPNPERKYGTNNAGDLKVIATYGAGATALTAEAHLIATVQRWNTPPIQ